LKSVAFSSSFAASYAVSIRQASVLPAASSRFHLAMDTLAVRLTIPPAGFVEDFHLQMNAPCRAHNTNGEAEIPLRQGKQSNRIEFTSDPIAHPAGERLPDPCNRSAPSSLRCFEISAQ
jgi:hypothetical protein